MGVEEENAPMLQWFQQLDRAQGAASVVEIARDYLATWTPEEIARLPRDCRPGRVRSASDLEDLHSCAVDAYRSTRATGDELTALQLLTSFLVRANVRLAQLKAVDADDSDDPNDSPTPPQPPIRQSKPREH